MAAASIEIGNSPLLQMYMYQLRCMSMYRFQDAMSFSFISLSALCSSHIPPNSDLHREWLAYQEKLRTAIECFQVSQQQQQHDLITRSYYRYQLVYVCVYTIYCTCILCIYMYCTVCVDGNRGAGTGSEVW